MKDSIIMVVSELEDGREHIHAKQNKPIRYDLEDKNDLKTLENYHRLWIDDRVMCYSKDLTQIWRSQGTPKGEKVMVKSVRYEPYDENLHIAYRTFSIMYDPKAAR